MMSGGRKVDVGEGQCSSNVVDFIIEHSNDSQMFTRSTVFDFTNKKLTLSLILHEIVDGQCIPYVHLMSTRRHLRDKCSQAFPVFRCPGMK